MSTEAESFARYSEGAAMPEEYKDLLVHLIWISADTETSLLFPETDWLQHVIDLAPTPRDRVTIGALYAEELTHGFIYFNLLRGLGVEASANDFRGPRKLYFADTPMTTWADLAFFNCLTDRVGMYQARELIGCSYEPLARVAPKITKDEVGHANIGYSSVMRICQTPEGRAEAQRALEKWYPIALDMFGSSSSKRSQRYIEIGLKKTPNAELRRQFIEEVTPLMTSVGLTMPDPTVNRKFN